MNRNERVFQFVADNGLTYSEFARIINVSKHLVSNWKNKNQAVPDKHIIAMVEIFPKLNARWLITGTKGNEEEMQKIKTFEQYKSEFEQNYKEAIEMLKISLQDKERIIKLKDEINNDYRRQLEELKALQ